MIKLNWNTIAKVLKYIATVITSVLGTMAVQSCGPHWFKIMPDTTTTVRWESSMRVALMRKGVLPIPGLRPRKPLSGHF